MPHRLLLLLLVLAPALVTAAPDTTSFPTPGGIKGLQVQMNEDALELGIHHAGVNVNLTALLNPAADKSSPKHSAGGREFAFNAAYLNSLDGQIKPLSDKGVLVYLILIAYPSGDAARDAEIIHPDARPDRRYSVGGLRPGPYLQAVVELLAQRWSGAHPGHGRVWGWIVGNEVNSHFLWHNMGKKPLAAAVAEYEKAFRVVHAAVRTGSVNARLYIPFDHHWAAAMHNVSAEEAAPGRDFLDEFARVVRSRGELDWHVAWHPYPEDLGNPRAWADKSVTRGEDTPKVTFKNLEVLCRHLEKPELLYEGKPRRVILSEQGFHTLLTPEGEILQAAAYAYAWEKCRRLPLVDAFIYHRHVDHAQEGGLRLGLWRNAPGSVVTPHSKKRLWELFQKAGTPEWEAAAAFALPVAGLKSWDEVMPADGK